MGSLGPNLPLPFKMSNGEAFGFLSWNTQGLAVVDTASRSRKFQFLMRIASNNFAICLQEVHGMPEELRSAFDRVLPGWGFFHSPVLNSDGVMDPSFAGVCILIHPKWINSCMPRPFVLVDGRAMGVDLHFDSSCISVYNVHNFGLNRNQVIDVSSQINASCARDQENPSCSCTFLFGDFNFRHPLEPPVFLGVVPNEDDVYNPPPPTNSHVSLWKQVLENFVEMHQSHPTHFCSASQMCTRIDYGFISLPGSLLIKLQVTASTHFSPFNAYYSQLGDHAPLGFSIGFKRTQTGTQQTKAIPKAWTQQPIFKEYLDCLIAHFDLDQAHPDGPLARLILYKKCLNEAARHTRDYLNLCGSDCEDHLRLSLDSMSRAVWWNNVTLAKKLISVSAFVRHFITIIDGHVLPIDAAEFEKVYVDYKKRHHTSLQQELKDDIEKAVAQNTKKQLKSRLKASRRQSAIWFPRLRKIRTLGIRPLDSKGGAVPNLSPAAPSSSSLSAPPPTVAPLPEPVVVTKPSDVQHSLQHYWAPVYAAKECDGDAARKLLQVYRRRNQDNMCFNDLGFPEKDVFVSVICKTKHSRPGRDSLPYHAYKADPELSGEILHDVAWVLSQSSIPGRMAPPGATVALPGVTMDPLPENCLTSPLGPRCKSEGFEWQATGEVRQFETNPLHDFLTAFNAQDVCFIPKGDEPNDLVAPSRTPDMLRTIFLANTDNKIIASAINRHIIDSVLCVTPFFQRGFCPGRQFCNNIVTLDTFSHIFNQFFLDSVPEGVEPETFACENASCCPVMPLFDICNAFPSIAHEWLFSVLKCLGLPPFIYRLIEMLYYNCCAYSSGLGTGELLFNVGAGVRTGCPLSATLFVLAFNPILDLFAFLADGPKISKTCVAADDVGAVLKKLEGLKIFHAIFQLAARVSNMHLKPSKCYIIISVCNLSPSLLAAVRCWLVSNIPLWADFKIVSCAKYLGVFLGRGGIVKSFEAPTIKYNERVKEIAEAGAPTLLSILRYNERAASVFSFIAQVCPIPVQKEFAATEQRGVHKMLRLPPNSMSRKLMHTLEPFLCKSPVCLIAWSKAAMYRYAYSVRNFLITLHAEAFRTLGDDITLVNFVNRKIPCAGYDQPALINCLFDGLKLEGDFGQYKVLENRQTDWSWIFQSSPPPPHVGSKIQSAVYQCFKVVECCKDFPLELTQKLVVTLGPEISNSLQVPIDFVNRLTGMLTDVRPQVAICVFKTIIGGWTTSHRMHEPSLLPCIFGCQGETDTINHYLLCAPLWLICSESLGIESQWNLLSRICVCNPRPESAQLLSLVFLVYHHTKSRLKEAGGFGCMSFSRIQSIASEAARELKHHV